MSDSQSIREIDERQYMRLWTWQRRVFDITDGTVPVDSLKYSEYLKSEFRRKTFEQLWKVLGTCQILWCFTDETEAIDYGRGLKGDYDLWELKVEETQPHWKVCSMAWNWILSQYQTKPPSRFEWLISIFEKHISGYNNTFDTDFNLAWKMKPLEDRWKELFFKETEVMPECTDVVLPHPVDQVCKVKQTPANEVMQRSPATTGIKTKSTEKQLCSRNFYEL